MKLNCIHLSIFSIRNGVMCGLHCVGSASQSQGVHTTSRRPTDLWCVLGRYSVYMYFIGIECLASQSQGVHTTSRRPTDLRCVLGRYNFIYFIRIILASQSHGVHTTARGPTDLRCVLGRYSVYMYFIGIECLASQSQGVHTTARGPTDLWCVLGRSMYFIMIYFWKIKASIYCDVTTLEWNIFSTLNVVKVRFQ